MSFLLVSAGARRAVRPDAAPSFDFSAASVPTDAALTRSGTATYIDSAGVLQDASADAARFDYDPATLALRGMLFEPQRQNKVVNSIATGASAPSTVPTGWSIGTSSNGLTRSIVGVGTESGHPYVDVRWAGTTTATNATTIYFGAATDAIVSTDDEIAAAVCVRVSAGALTNITKNQLRLVERTAAGAFTGSAFGSADFTPTTDGIAQNRFEVTHTIVAADCERTQLGHRFEYTTGTAIDVTFRYSLPQIEAGTYCTSAIKTSSAAVTRQADALLLTVANGTYDITYTLGTTNGAGTNYSITDTVANGTYLAYLPPAALAAAERHIQSTAMALTQIGSNELVAPFDFEAMLDAAPGDNPATTLGAAPTYVYTIADEAVWDVRCDATHDAASVYIASGRTNTSNLDAIITHLVALADDDAMALNADTVYAEGNIKNYRATASWAKIHADWAYLKTKGASAWDVVSDATTKRAKYVAYSEARARDIMWYYTFETDTLGSKQNNHFFFGVQAAMLGAIVSNQRDIFEWCVAAIKHLYDDSLPDVLKDTGTGPMCGYNPDSGTEPLPARGIIQYDLDRYVSNSQDDGVYYNWYCAATVIMTSICARANGVNLLTYTGTNGDLDGIVSAYKAICDDAGAAVYAWKVAHDTRATGLTSAATLDVATHKTDRDIASFRLLTALPEFSGHAAAATIDANLAGKDNGFWAGDVDTYRAYLV